MDQTAALRQDWFDVREMGADVVAIAEPLHDQWVKSYLVIGDERAALIDTGMGVGDMRALVAELTDKPIIVVNSHAHWDHIGGNASFFGDTEILIHAAEAAELEHEVSNQILRDWFGPHQLRGPLPPGFDVATAVFPPTPATRILYGGESLDLGGRRLEVIPAPGHSPGLIALLDRANGILFSTDAAYPDDLYAQFEDSDLDAYVATMTTFAELAPSLRTVLPSHAAFPMDPALLPRMRDGLIAVVAGRTPDAIEEDLSRHIFDGFTVLAPPSLYNRRGVEGRAGEEAGTG